MITIIAASATVICQHKTEVIVVFKPTKATIKECNEHRAEGGWAKVQIHDGKPRQTFISDGMRKIIQSIYDERTDTLLVTVET